MRSSKTIIAGFASILILILILVGVWIKNIRDAESNVHELANKLNESQLVFAMRDAALRRVITIFQLSASIDPFERDEQWMASKRLAEKFIVAREQLLQHKLTQQELASWYAARPHVIHGNEMQNRIIELILADRVSEASKLLREEGIPTQENVMRELTKFLDAQNHQVGQTLRNVETRYRNTLILVGILGGSCVVVGLFVMFFVLQRTEKAERENMRQLANMRAIHEISSMPGLGYDQRIQRMLQTGCALFGLEIGKICQVDTAKNIAAVTYAHTPKDRAELLGLHYDLDNNICGIAFANDAPTIISNISASNENRCRELEHIETYIAQPIFVNGERFGIVNFIDHNIRAREFSENEKEFLKLIANWVGVTIEHKVAENRSETAKHMAEQASQAKSDFLANMSHEIRTPLTAIIGFSETLLDEEQSKEENDHAVSTIVRSGHHLQQIVNDILDLSKIEAGKLEVEQISVSPVEILHVVDSIAGSKARQKGLDFNITFSTAIPKHIQSDPTRLKQILINLCGNAVKFTEAGHVSICVSYNVHTENLVFVVSDTGIGIAENELEKLFKPFSQADTSTTRKHGGTGLGLTISRQLAEMLGGSLNCSSRIGEGSEFVLSLNVGAFEHDQLHKAADFQDDATSTRVTQTDMTATLQGKILLVEDTKENQDLISLYLRRFKLSDITIAENGAKALAYCGKQKFDLILMDMQMPIMGGIEATRKIRELGICTPIIALTANAMNADRKASAEAGCNDYCSKPINLQQFSKLLYTYLDAIEDAGTPQRDTSPNYKPRTNDLRDLDSRDPIYHEPEFQDLIEIFVQSLPTTIRDLQVALEDKDFKTIKMLVHNLRGTGGGLGFSTLSNLAGNIQRLLVSGQTEPVPELVSQLTEACELVYSSAA